MAGPAKRRVPLVLDGHYEGALKDFVAYRTCFGLNRAEYCRGHALSCHAMTYWLRKNCKRNTGQPTLMPAPFQAGLNIPAPRSSGNVVRVVLPGDVIMQDKITQEVLSESPHNATKIGYHRIVVSESLKHTCLSGSWFKSTGFSDGHNDLGVSNDLGSGFEDIKFVFQATFSSSLRVRLVRADLENVPINDGRTGEINARFTRHVANKAE